jgi:hypothetical protein
MDIMHVAEGVRNRIIHHLPDSIFDPGVKAVCRYPEKELQ